MSACSTLSLKESISPHSFLDNITQLDGSIGKAGGVRCRCNAYVLCSPMRGHEMHPNEYAPEENCFLSFNKRLEKDFLGHVLLGPPVMCE